jgi:hypothetical protein
MADRIVAGHHGQVTDRATVSRWLAGHEAAWRAPGTDGLAGIFTDDAAYRDSHWAGQESECPAVIRPAVLTYRH